MAFTVVLATNLFIVGGSVRSGQASVVEELPQQRSLAMEELATKGDAAPIVPLLPQTEP